MEEIWKNIDDIYLISNLGNIYSNHSKRMLKQSNDKDGYKIVCLHRKTYRVHRLVAKYFLDNPNNLPEVNHKDEDKTNNCVSNLEYCDRLYNIRYGTGVQRSCENRGKPIIQMDMEGNIIREWNSISEATRGLNFSTQYLIYRCCIGERKSSHNFKFKYKE